MEWLGWLCSGGTQPWSPSCVLVVAHPDDEIVGAGSRVARMKRSTIVYVTDGAPRNLYDATAAGFTTAKAYSDARLKEAHAALALAGIAPGQTRQLNFSDQEASFRLSEIVERVHSLLKELEPDIVLTHPFEGGHPDHDSTAFAVHAACRRLEEEGKKRPTIVEMAFYHRKGDRMEVGQFLPVENRGSSVGVHCAVLDSRERVLKQQMFACHASQADTLRSFSLETERFRLAPDYDFLQPPHAGSPLYEWYDWGMTGARWRTLARAAETRLNQ